MHTAWAQNTYTTSSMSFRTKMLNRSHRFFSNLPELCTYPAISPMPERAPPMTDTMVVAWNSREGWLLAWPFWHLGRSLCCGTSATKTGPMRKNGSSPKKAKPLARNTMEPPVTLHCSKMVSTTRNLFEPKTRYQPFFQRRYVAINPL